MSLINCEIELDLSWSKECIIPELSRTATVATNPPYPAGEAAETNSSTKLYGPLVTLSINDNIKFSKNIKKTIYKNNFLKQI